jgi:outer membrane protein assembly factor BamB
VTRYTGFFGASGRDVSGSPVVADGVLYVISRVSTTQTESLEAFDATGKTGCSGTPKTCVPLWTAPLGTGSGSTSPAVVNGVVYAGSSDNLQAFDAAGSTNCAGTPKTCSPLWSASVGPVDGSAPVVANGDVYIGSTNDNLYAFDAAGGANCTGTPMTCSPLWQAPTGGPIESSAAVDNGVVYIGSNDDNIYAFSAVGTTNCSGTPTVCTPLWSGATAGPVESAPAVANGTVYVGTDGPNTLYDGDLYAFDAAGKTNCSGSTCSPLWVGEALGGVKDSPAVSGGYVYVSELGHITSNVDAFDAAGNTDCSGSPKLCSPLWHVGSAAYPSSVAVAGGLVYAATNSLGISIYTQAGSVVGNIQSSSGYTSSPVVANGFVYAGGSSGFAAFDVLQTQVLVPQNGATLSGSAVLDAAAPGGGDVTSVQFVASGGTLSDTVVGTATLTYYGWIALWNTSSVPNGTYTVQAVADAPLPAPMSAPITVTVSNGSS